MDQESAPRIHSCCQLISACIANVSLCVDGLAILRGKVDAEFSVRRIRISDIVVDEAQRRGRDINYQSIGFCPYTPETRSALALDHGVLNTFGGFPYREMDAAFDDIDWSPIRPLLDFMKTVLCSDAGGGAHDADT